MIKNNIFISHASEDKEILVEPFIRCLEQNGICHYWYDKEQIETGDIIVKRINEGLSSSKIVAKTSTQHYVRKRAQIYNYFHRKGL